MDTNEQKLKDSLKEIIKSLMPTNSYVDFKNAVSSVIAMYKVNKEHDGGSAVNYDKIISLVREISYQSVVNKMADKNAEKLLVLNEDGSSTGEFFERKTVHNKKKLLWHREVAGIVLRENGTFAIITRSSEKSSYPGAKGLICGHVEGTSSCHEAVVAECSEEVGTLFAQEKFIRLMNPTKNEREDNKAFTTPYIVASQLKDGVFIYQEQEVDGMEWITVDKLRQYVSLSHNPATADMVIFKDNEFYRGLADSLELLFTLENWHDYLANGDYKTIHKHLGIVTPKNEVEFYESKEKMTAKPAVNTAQNDNNKSKK